MPMAAFTSDGCGLHFDDDIIRLDTLQAAAFNRRRHMIGINRLFMQSQAGRFDFAEHFFGHSCRLPLVEARSVFFR
jgi:hypothetical protein